MNEIYKQRIEKYSEEYVFENCEREREVPLVKDAYQNGWHNALQNQWISVEEALPEKNTMCFVRKETEVGIIYDADYIDCEGKWFFNFNRTSINSMVITHWMQIPSLKGGEK